MEMIPYDASLAKYFKSLNIAWLQKYFVVEPIDEEMLSHPDAYILKEGGYIYFAKLNEAIVGCFALIKIDKETFELSKMAVAENYQGKKIGNKMLEFCIQESVKLNAKKLILFSNTLLQPAIHLYKKYGFVEVPIGNVAYKRANIKMEKFLL